MSKNKKSGFTLLELIVVLVIISLATVLTVPRITASLAGLSLQEASRKTASSLRYASSRAVSTNTDIRAVVDFENSKLLILEARFDNDAEAEAYIEDDENTERIHIYTLPDNIVFYDARESGSEYFHIVFFSNGGCTGGSVVLENQKENRIEIRIDFITATVKIMESSE